MKQQKPLDRKWSCLFFRLLLTTAFSILFISLNCWPLQIQGGWKVDLEVEPGTETVRKFVVINDENNANKIELRVEDWYRNPKGQNKYLSPNSARWEYENSLDKGEEITLRYRTPIPEDFSAESFQITGEVRTTSPADTVKIGGDNAYQLSENEIRSEEPQQGEAPLKAVREISAGPQGKALHVSIKLEAKEYIASFTLVENFPMNTKVEPLGETEAKFLTVDRSCSDWIKLERSEFVLESGEKREVKFHLSVPSNVSGTYWSIIFVKGTPRTPPSQEGTTITAAKEFGLKVYETVPGTQKRSGVLSDFSVKKTSPPSYQIKFNNRGNVKLSVSGNIQLMDDKGNVIDKTEVKSFPILPGFHRIIEVPAQGTSGLQPGKYRALAIMEYGGLKKKAGAKTTFSIEPLDLSPVGESINLPHDPDGDGLYEDVNGDGKLDQKDIITFSFNFDTPPIQENGRAFDFNEDGKINDKDMVALRSSIESG